jgi:secreted trypsin-like serine protease
MIVPSKKNIWILLSLFFFHQNTYCQNKIVGGNDANISDHPWQVAVEYNGPDFGSYCGGSIIGDSWILTAAHCVDGSGPASSYTIHAGSSNNWAYGGESYNVIQVISHPSYDDQWLHNDIALVQIEGTFNLSENIASINLISVSDVEAGLQDPGILAISTGWGVSTSEYLNDTIVASSLQMIEVPLVSNEVACGDATDLNGFSGDYPCLFGLELELYNESTIYAGDLENGGLSAASGDSGGPLIVPNTDNTGWLLIGVTSGGYTPGMPQYPMGYTTVSHYLEWIFNHAEVNSEYGCLDENACNYDAEALNDHGFCYELNSCGNCEPDPLHGFDCYGECISGEKIHIEVDDIVSAYPASWYIGDYSGIRGSYDVCLEEGCHIFNITKDAGGPWMGYNYTITQGSDILAEMYLDEGQGASLLVDVNSECIPIFGCYDTLALNFSLQANSYDGSCVYPIEGCSDETAYNYFVDAEINDGSCFYPSDCIGATLLLVNVNEAYAEYLTESISWDFEGFEGNAGEEQLICVQPGCHTFNMSSFTGPGWLGGVAATISTIEGEELMFATLDSGFDGSIEVDVNSNCEFIYGCTNPIAFNYNSLANQDNGFCHLPVIDCGDSTTVFMEFTGGDYNYLILWELNGISGNSYPFDGSPQGQFCLGDGCYIYNMFNDPSLAPVWWDDTSPLGWGGSEVTITASGGNTLATGTLSDTNFGSMTFSLNQENCEFNMGCSDSLALNFDSNVNAEDGSCIYPIYGCMDSLDLFFSPIANVDDDSCSKISCEGLNRLSVNITGNYIASVGWNMTGFEGGEGENPVCVEDGCHSFAISTYDENGIENSDWFDAEISIINQAGELLINQLIDSNSPTTNFTLALNSSEVCVSGCTNPLAFNYEPLANANDGSCIAPSQCQDGTPYILLLSDSWPYGDHINALIVSGNNGDQFSTLFAGSLNEANESICLNDGCNIFSIIGPWANEISWELVDTNQVTFMTGSGNSASIVLQNSQQECDITYGCMDPIALNYNQAANGSDNSCDFIEGCTNSSALNFNPEAIIDNNSCEFPSYGCTDPNASNYNSGAVINDGTCYYAESGCSDSLAFNFDPNAIEDILTCIYPLECEDSNLIHIEVSPGQYPSEVSWMLNTYSGEVGLSQACLNEGCHSFTMFDSYGDGWNDAVFTISYSGNQVLASGTLETGLNETLDFCVDFSNPLILGCTDSTAINFNSIASQDDESCEYENTAPLCQEINLPQGWSIFSTYIIEEDLNLDVMLESVSGDIIIVKDYLGNAYLPEYLFNGIGEMTIGQGYFIKTEDSLSIDFCGDYALPEQNPINISEGWNVIAYLRIESAAITSVMSELSDLIIAKNYAGNVYLPDYFFNGIGNMNSGEGYQIKTGSDDILHYLSNNDSYRFSSLELIKNATSHFTSVPITDNNMTIVITDEAWDEIPTIGSEIAAFNSKGEIIGTSIYTPNLTVLTLWGSETISLENEDIRFDKKISFKLWNTNNIKDLILIGESIGSYSYSPNAINIVSEIQTQTITKSCSSKKNLTKIINILGQDVTKKDLQYQNQILFYIYDDGSVEKKNK